MFEPSSVSPVSLIAREPSNDRVNPSLPAQVFTGWCRSVLFIVLLVGSVLACVTQTAIASQSLYEPTQLVKDAAVYLLPDASRTPLTTLPSGTSVTVLQEAEGWS